MAYIAWVRVCAGRGPAGLWRAAVVALVAVAFVMFAGSALATRVRVATS